MKINDRFSIQIAIAEMTDDGYGDIYDSLEEFNREKPDSRFKFGYVVIDMQMGCVPDECNDWNETIQEAIVDYNTHCH